MKKTTVMPKQQHQASLSEGSPMQLPLPSNVEDHVKIQENVSNKANKRKQNASNKKKQSKPTETKKKPEKKPMGKLLPESPSGMPIQNAKPERLLSSDKPKTKSKTKSQTVASNQQQQTVPKAVKDEKITNFGMAVAESEGKNMQPSAGTTNKPKPKPKPKRAPAKPRAPATKIRKICDKPVVPVLEVEIETLDDPPLAQDKQQFDDTYEDIDPIVMPSSEDIWQSYLDVKEGRINQTEAQWPISLMCDQSSDLRLEETCILLKKRLPQPKAPVYDYNAGNIAVAELLKWQMNHQKKPASEPSEDAEPCCDEVDDSENDVEMNNLVEEDPDLKEWIQSELLNEPLTDIEEYDMLLNMANDNTNYDTLYKLLKPQVIDPEVESPELTEDDGEDNTQETSCSTAKSNSEEESSPEMTELNKEQQEEIPIEEVCQKDSIEELIGEHLEELLNEPTEESIKQTIEEPNEKPIELLVQQPIEEILEKPIGNFIEVIIEQSVDDLIEESIEDPNEEHVEMITEETANTTPLDDINAKVEMPKAKERKNESMLQEEQIQTIAEDEVDFASFIDLINDKVVPADAIKSTVKQLESELMLHNNDDKKLENQIEQELPELPLILDVQELPTLPPKPMDETAHQEWLQECSQRITEQLQQIAFSVADAKPQGIDYEMEISKEQLKPSISVSPKRLVNHTGFQNKFVEMLDDFEDDVLQNMTEFRDPQAKRVRSKWYAQCSKTVENLRRTLVLPALPHPFNECLQKIRILRRTSKRQEPYRLSIEMKYVRTFCTLQTNRQMELMSLLSVLDNSIYCPEVDVLQKRYESTQLAWLWRDGTVMIINGRSEKMLAETQNDLVSRILRVRKILCPQYCHNVTYLRLTFHAQFPWKIDLSEFNRASVLSPEPIQGTNSRYAYYVNKDFPGVAARVFESGAIAVYAMSPAEADQMFECIYLTTSKYRAGVTR